MTPTPCAGCGATRPPTDPRHDRLTVALAGGAAAAVTAAIVWWTTHNWEMLLVYPTAFGLGGASLVANDRALARSRARQGRCPACGEPRPTATAGRAGGPP